MVLLRAKESLVARSSETTGGGTRRRLPHFDTSGPEMLPEVHSVGMTKHTLYAWKRKFEAEGPAGLLDKARGGPAVSRLPEPTRRAILMLKEANPDWGWERIAALLLRGPALPASPQAVARVLREAGYELEE